MIWRSLGVFGLVTASIFCALSPARADLLGQYYLVSSDPGSVNNALTTISGVSPTATFNASTICFPSCNISPGGDPTPISDSSTLSAFLGAGHYTNLSADVTGLGNHVLVLTGWINIPATAEYAFNLYSDDGSRLWIGNNLVNNDG